MSEKLNFPNPNQVFPINGVERVCFIKNTITNPRIEVGDYTYFDDPEDSQDFERNVLYHFDFIGDKLTIGKFCAIATGVRFIMNGANHRMDGWSTYPFAIFGPPWSDALDGVDIGAPPKGDTVVGHDVWLGYGVTVMPGVQIGHGAIVASKSVVTSDVSPYGIVGGNPAKLIRKRFDDELISLLLEIAWWDWPYESISQHVKTIFCGDLAALQQAAEQVRKGR